MLDLVHGFPGRSIHIPGDADHDTRDLVLPNGTSESPDQIAGAMIGDGREGADGHAELVAICETDVPRSVVQRQYPPKAHLFIGSQGPFGVKLAHAELSACTHMGEEIRAGVRFCILYNRTVYLPSGDYMLHKGKLAVFLGSALVVVYGISAAYYDGVAGKDEAYRELAVFMEALRRINDDYVEHPNINEVQEGAMRGLMDALDPYSGFLTKEEAEQVASRLESGTADLGLVLSKRSDLFYVVAVRKDGASAGAGVRPGDYIVAVDGKSVEGKSLVVVESFLRGPAGSSVKISIFRGAQEQPSEIELTRQEQDPAPPHSQLLEGKIGLLAISTLSGPPDPIGVKLRTLLSAGADRIILDLRDCADGSVEHGTKLANMFLKEGVIYVRKDMQGETIQIVRAAADAFVTDLPLVLLVNGSTAGAAEVVAGAIKDAQRGTLVGEKTFGAGSSQEQISLKGGSILILSTSKFFTPSGHAIQQDVDARSGIAPDIQAPDDERQRVLMVESYYDHQEDQVKYEKLRERIRNEQLERAVQTARELVGSRKRAA